jgi:hypothetical protein
MKAGSLWSSTQQQVGVKQACQLRAADSLPCHIYQRAMLVQHCATTTSLVQCTKGRCLRYCVDSNSSSFQCCRQRVKTCSVVMYETPLVRWIRQKSRPYCSGSGKMLTVQCFVLCQHYTPQTPRALLCLILLPTANVSGIRVPQHACYGQVKVSNT